MNVHENQYWVNPGVIGMPANDGTARVWFATLDDTTRQTDFTFHHLNYDHKTASMLMRTNGLPQSYANTLQTGLWDNCEILPPEETALQGKPIAW
jgi:diadenosine tetraphosphatase ApaH/serine/threonine PP2A family protein phosphatase